VHDGELPTVLEGSNVSDDVPWSAYDVALALALASSSFLDDETVLAVLVQYHVRYLAQQ
jgi:hypothetical protein